MDKSGNDCPFCHYFIHGACKQCPLKIAYKGNCTADKSPFQVWFDGYDSDDERSLAARKIKEVFKAELDKLE